MTLVGLMAFEHALRAGLEAMRPRGVVVQLGLGGDVSLPQNVVVAKELSVRQTEDLVRRTQREEGRRPGKTPEEKKTPAVRDVEDRLQKALGTRVTLRPKDARSGVIEVHYHSLDELDGLILRLTGEQ